MMKRIPHNHLTRDVKDMGKCHGCDQIRVISARTMLREARSIAIRLKSLLIEEHQRSAYAPIPHKRPCTSCELIDKYTKIIEAWSDH